MSLAIQDKQARRRQPQNRAESTKQPSRDSADTDFYEDSESDGDETHRAIGTCGAEPYIPLDAGQIPQTPQGDYLNCVAHAVATNIWLVLLQKYGERYTPNKQEILTIIMTCCNGCGPRPPEDFLSDCRKQFNRQNTQPVNFMVSGGKLIQIIFEYRKIPKFDHVVEMLKARPVLVSVVLKRRDLHLVCALSAAGEGIKQHLCAYHSWKDEPNMKVYRDTNQCEFQVGYRLDVTIVSVLDPELEKLSARELLEAKHAVVVQHEPVASAASRHTITAADSINAFFSVLTRATIAGVCSAITRLCGKRRREDGQ